MIFTSPPSNVSDDKMIFSKSVSTMGKMHVFTTDPKSHFLKIDFREKPHDDFHVVFPILEQ